MRTRHRFIVVGSEPYRVWPDHNVVPASLFLEGINHRYFESMANLFQGAVNSDTSWAAQMALRTTYGQASEALFALLFSLLQAPYDTAAWLLLYQPGDVAKLIDRFERGEELPSIVTLPAERSWRTLVQMLHPFEGSEIDDPEGAITSIAEIWQLLAEEIRDPAARAEYNSLKHGFRAKWGGQMLAVGGSLLLASDAGTTFPMLAQKRSNVLVRLGARSWSPDRLCATLRIIGSSICSILSALRQINNPVAPGQMHLELPDASDFQVAAPKARIDGSIVLGPSWTAGGEPPSPVDVEEALAWYRDHSMPLVVVRRPVNESPNPPAGAAG